MVELADSAHGLKKGPKSDDLISVDPLDGREGRMGTDLMHIGPGSVSSRSGYTCPS